jgi:hypothetical protein
MERGRVCSIPWLTTRYGTINTWVTFRNIDVIIGMILLLQELLLRPMLLWDWTRVLQRPFSVFRIDLELPNPVLLDREWIALILTGLLLTVNLFSSWKFFGTSIQLDISCNCWRLSEVWVCIALICLWSPAGSAQHIDSQTRKRVMSHSIFLSQPERQVTNNLSFRMCSVAWIYIFFNLTSRDTFMS